MTDTTRLIEMLKVLKGSWIGDGIHPSIATGAIIDALEQQAAQIEAKDAEIARLTECLSKANANHEHFERAWYLRGDEVEALRADAERLRALATCGCGDGFTAHDPGTCGNCMAAIDAALRQEGPKP